MSSPEQDDIEKLDVLLRDQCRALVDAANLTNRMVARQAITTIADKLMEVLMARDARIAANLRSTR